MSDKRGWKTVRTKDGKRELAEPFYASNPAYIAAHPEWEWEEISFADAYNGMVSGQLACTEPGDKEI